MTGTREAGPIRLGLVSHRPISPAFIAHARALLAACASNIEVVEYRPDGFAAAALTAHGGPVEGEIREELVSAGIALGVDVAILHGRLATSRPGLIVSDVDSTFLAVEVIEKLAARAGQEEAVREVTERAMRGEMDFTESLNERVATLAGLPTTILSDVQADLELTPGADRLVELAHTHGAKVGLVSGGFTQVLDPLATRHGVDMWEAITLGTEAGKLTGTVTGRIVDREAKVEIVTGWASDLSIPLDRVVCVGDGANDLGMMGVAGLGVSFCGKPIMRERADARVSFRRLDAVAAFFGWI